MIVTVTGGRDFSDRGFVYYVLDGMHASERVTTVRQGGGKGLDWWARWWCGDRQVPVQTFQAVWENGKRAGPIRNRKMLEARPLCDGVVAFPGGKGTQNCVQTARSLGLPVFEVSKLYQEWLDRPKSLGELAVEATRALMEQMRADQAESGVLTLDLGGRGELRNMKPQLEGQVGDE